jgi:DNA-binding NarL/FixJ family response regulator
MTLGGKNQSTMFTRQQHALHLHRCGWSRQRIARELGIGEPAVSRLLRRALGPIAAASPSKIPRTPRPQRIRPLSLAHYA